MKMIIKSNEISKVARILANNNFINVKNVDNLYKYLDTCIANFYILSLQKNFASYIKYNKNFNKATNFFNVFVSDYNFLFNEIIEIKKEDIEISIIDGDNYDK